MRIHHLNCGTCCPMGGALFDGISAGPLGRLVCHCLLIETDAGLVLVDTGFGTKDVHDHNRLPLFFRLLNNIQLLPEETAVHQIRRLGFRPEEVRHILISHLDFDHAGGIEDFPNATVHLLAREHQAAMRHDGGIHGNRRYQTRQWDEVRHWQFYQSGAGDRWMGFDAVRALEGLPPEILLVPLAGHTWGHSGVAIREDSGNWLFYAGDAYFYRGEIGAPQRRCTPGLRFYQNMMDTDRAARVRNQARLRRLSLERAGEVRIFCAHDPVEFDILADQDRDGARRDDLESRSPRVPHTHQARPDAIL
jgi:glyoxylase-like metal-dependent hydrolase (beta-lactamase superfamily II)